jgi:hypothetical protein
MKRNTAQSLSEPDTRATVRIMFNDYLEILRRFFRASSFKDSPSV